MGIQNGNRAGSRNSELKKKITSCAENARKKLINELFSLNSGKMLVESIKSRIGELLKSGETDKSRISNIIIDSIAKDLKMNKNNYHLMAKLLKVLRGSRFRIDS